MQDIKDLACLFAGMKKRGHYEEKSAEWEKW